MCTASSAWFAAFTASPAPTGPQSTSFSPKASSTGRTRSNVLASPPHITVSVPFSAPIFPPLTGASMKSMPRSASSAASRRDVAGSPEVQSTSTEPLASPPSSPSGAWTSASTSRELGTHVTTTSAARAASAGVAATAAVVSAAKARALSALRFHTVSVNGGTARCRAIGVPMAPRPRKATRIKEAEREGAPSAPRVALAQRDNIGTSPVKA